MTETTKLGATRVIRDLGFFGLYKVSSYPPSLSLSDWLISLILMNRVLQLVS